MPPRGKERLRAIVSLCGPKHPAHRGGRADQSERTEVVRTSDGKEINIIDKQNARFARISLVNFASQNFGLYGRFLRRKQLISSYIFPGDSKLRVNNSTVKIPLFLGEKSPSRLKEGLRAIVSLHGPKHPAHRGGRADQSERTEVVRTARKLI